MKSKKKVVNVLIIVSEEQYNSPIKFDMLKYFSKKANIEFAIVGKKRDVNDFIPVIKVTLKYIFRINNYDYVVSMCILHGIFLIFLQKIFGKNFFHFKHIIIDIGSTYNLIGIKKFLLKLIKYFFSSAYKIICHASSSLDFWKNEVGISNVMFVSLPTNTEFLVPENVNGDYIFSAGRVGRDFGTLIDAVAGLNEKIVLVGDDKNFKKVENKIKTNNNIIFYKNIVFEKYKKLLVGSKIVVLPLEKIKYHTGQTVLVQAMSMGKAVIVTKSNGTIDYVEDGVNGLFVDYYDVEGLRKKIIYLLKHEDERLRLGKNARVKAEKSFSEKSFVQKIEEIIFAEE